MIIVSYLTGISCTENIILNRFVYLEAVEELPTDTIRQIYYGDRRNHARSEKNGHPILVDDTFFSWFHLYQYRHHQIIHFVIFFRHIKDC